MFWLVPTSVSVLILLWANWPKHAAAHGRLGYDDIIGPIRLAASIAIVLLVWIVTLSAYFIAL